MRAKYALALLLGLFAGCQRRQAMPTTPFVHEESTYKLIILFDLSGSFAQMMAYEGKGYEFAMEVIDKYFRGRIGTDDTIVIAQISANSRALLWEGTPVQLRQQFADAEAFRDFLLSKADPNASLVYDGIAHTVEYVVDEPSVASGKVTPAVFVLSDMLENGPDPEKSQQRLVAALKKLADRNGIFALYYVDQFQLAKWRQHLRDSGFKTCVIEAEIVGRPPLPDFDQ